MRIVIDVFLGGTLNILHTVWLTYSGLVPAFSGNNPTWISKIFNGRLGLSISAQRTGVHLLETCVLFSALGVFWKQISSSESIPFQSFDLPSITGVDVFDTVIIVISLAAGLILAGVFIFGLFFLTLKLFFGLRLGTLLQYSVYWTCAFYFIFFGFAPLALIAVGLNLILGSLVLLPMGILMLYLMYVHPAIVMGRFLGIQTWKALLTHWLSLVPLTLVVYFGQPFS